MFGARTSGVHWTPQWILRHAPDRAHEAGYAPSPIVPVICFHNDNGDRRVRCQRCSS